MTTDSEQKPAPKKWRKRLKKLLRLPLYFILILVVLFFGMRLFCYARNSYYDSKPSPIRLTLDDLTAMVDTNHDAQVTPSELPLREDLRRKLIDAKSYDKRLLIFVGKLPSSYWKKFHTTDDLILYCKLQHEEFEGVHIEKSLRDMKLPERYNIGMGAYLEIDHELNVKGLWTYQNIPGAVSHSILHFLSFGHYWSTESWLHRFTEKQFGWHRIPAQVLYNKIQINAATYTPESLPGGHWESLGCGELFLGADTFDDLKRSHQHPKPFREKLEVALANKEINRGDWDWDYRMASLAFQLELYAAATPEQQLLAVKQCLQRIRNRELGYEISVGFDWWARLACKDIIRQYPEDSIDPVFEDALYYFACIPSALDNLPEKLDALIHLEQNFPNSRHLPHAWINMVEAYEWIAGVACAGLEKDSDGEYYLPGGSYAAGEYYFRAFEALDKAISHTEMHGDLKLDMIWTSSWDEELPGTSIKQIAIRKRTKLANNVGQFGPRFFDNHKLFDYIDGEKGPYINPNSPR